ncbi:hypothetical protein K438DRAFT_510459 [Mycena galopus ATCC 62051]|nr:hypothetical protein K438DRAFT_510459 [Mycena galopus ATCC 62051]
MNPRTRADVMTLAPEHDTSHPFSYARILGIFHVDVVHNIPGATTVPTSIEVLWVRRFRIDTSYRAGFKAKRLHRLQFIPGDDPLAFDFLNPDEVIRGVHLIPAFAHGRTHDLLQRSISPEDDEEWFEEPDDDSAGWRSIALENEKNHEDGEWRYHYVNMFVDRDMYVRYVGGGVGHYKVEIGEEPDLELPEEGLMLQTRAMAWSASWMNSQRLRVRALQMVTRSPLQTIRVLTQVARTVRALRSHPARRTARWMGRMTQMMT